MQSDAAVIKCAQCGAQLIVPDCSDYGWRIPGPTHLEMRTLRLRLWGYDCESYASAPKAEIRYDRLHVR